MQRNTKSRVRSTSARSLASISWRHSTTSVQQVFSKPLQPPSPRLRQACAAAALCVAACLGAARAETELVIATVDNGHMVTMQAMSRHFERDNPGIKLRWVTLKEAELRGRVTAGVANRSRSYDVVTIGMYEVPIWARKGWLEEIEPDAAFEVNDLLAAIRSGLSHQGRLYAAPFYGESSMTIYRRDLVAKAGLSMPSQPTWTEVREIAARLHRPEAGQYGICLRGKPGWGENMALLTTMANAFGGQWFDMGWQPQVDTPPWRAAASLYLELLQRHGPPNPLANGFNENLKLFQEGRCAIWVDATIAASFVTDARQSKVADAVGFAQAPHGVSTKGVNWLWAWSLAIPAGTPKVEQARRFVRWAASRQYIELVGREVGWGSVPTGTRISTYKNPAFIRQAGRWAYSEASAIALANPADSTLGPRPYLGVQFAAIPEFAAIGDATGAQVAQALAGALPLADALAAAQASAVAEMRKAGYFK